MCVNFFQWQVCNERLYGLIFETLIELYKVEKTDFQINQLREIGLKSLQLSPGYIFKARMIF